MVNPIHNHLNVAICEDGPDAAAKGFNWTAAQPPVKPIEVAQVVVVRKGTEGGNATVDFVLQDDTGQRYVFMVTGNLLKSIPC